MNYMNITGSLVQAYIFCPRQAWLLSRQIVGNQYNEFLAIGRLLSEETYKREKKEIVIDGGKIDFIKTKDGNLFIAEVKKSGKFIETSKMQLLYYMYRLKQKGYDTNGEIRIPREKKAIKVVLSEENEKRIENILDELKRLLEQEHPPRIAYNRNCRNCSYFEFCWS